MEDFEAYLKGVLSQVTESYTILKNLRDQPGDLEIISRELAKTNGLLQVIVTKLETNKIMSDKYVQLSKAIKNFLENYYFEREIETMSKLYSDDPFRLKNIRTTILKALEDKKLIERIESLLKDD